MNVTWNKGGVYFNDLDISNYRARVDELTHVEIAKSAGKRLLHSLYVTYSLNGPFSQMNFITHFNLRFMPEGNLVII